MLVQSSYQLSRFAVDGDAEKQRLNAQVELFWQDELNLYRRVGLREGMKVLDCGCATGYLLEKLRTEFPGIDCTGIDPDPQLISTARERMGTLPGCHFLECSACSLDLADDTFDLVIARLVLEHLHDSPVALKELCRVLKPGGAAVVIDNDFDLHERTWPDSPSLGPLYEAYRSARRADGGNPCIGRELPGRLLAAGFADVSLSLLAAHSRIAGDEAFLRAEGAGIPAQLVKDGYLEPAMLDRIAAEWMLMLETPGHSIFRMLFACVGRKALSGPGGAQAKNIAGLPKPRLAGMPLTAPEHPLLESAEDIQRFMQNVLAADMEVAADSLPFDQSLLHLGVDSLAAMRLCNQLKSQMQISISMADVLSGKSIEDLTKQVLAMQKNIAMQPSEAQVSPAASRA
jgi:SAM-dependent methyltransferase/acyl carrier protein